MSLISGGQATYTVSYRDYLDEFINILNEDLDLYFDSVHEEVLKVIGAELASKEDLLLDGFPGRQVKFDIPESAVPGGGYGINRTYLVGTRRYDVMGIAVNGALVEGRLEAIVDSFQLLNPPDAAEIETAPEPATLSEWPEFSSEAGNFSTLLPTEPTENTNSFMSVVGEFEQHLFTAAQNNGIQYIVSYADLPGMLFVTNEKLINDTFDDGGSGALSAVNGTSIREMPITLGEFPGKHVEFEFTDPAFSGEGEGILQAYMVGNKMYNLIVMAPIGELIEEEANQFFESFQLLETPTIAQAAWQEFSPEDADFSVLFPTTPAETLDTNIRMLIVREGESTYMLQYGGVPAKYQADLDGFLDLVADNLPAEVNGTVIKAGDLSLADNPGREVMIEFSNTKYPAGGIQDHRLYIIDNVFYNLIVEGPQAGYPTERADQFLDSFQIDGATATSLDGQAVGTEGTAVDGQAFVSDAGKFSILFPEEPETKAQLISAASGQLDGYLFVASPSTAATYSVTYADSPQDFSLMDQAALDHKLDSLRDNFVGSWATILNEEEISLGDYPGRSALLNVQQTVFSEQ